MTKFWNQNCNTQKTTLKSTEMRHLFIALVLLAGLSLSSCNTRKIERIGTEETIDLSGRWNDSDSRMTADAMVEQILNSGWLDNHVRKTGERPVRSEERRVGKEYRTMRRPQP